MKKLHFGWISVLGLAFWFFLGFPFANHNESYIWVARLNQLGFLDFITLKETPFPFGRRPLGQAVVWLLYKASGGSMWPQQLFNFVLAAAAWYILFTAMKERKVFSLVALAVGGFFFSGYIYLFHIHGVWYSPVLLVTAVWFAAFPHVLAGRKYIWISVLSLVVSLCYPLALVVHTAFSVGLLLEKRRDMTTKQRVTVGASIILALAALRVLGSASVSLSLGNAVRLVSYRMMELNSCLTVVAILLCLVTLASFRIRWQGKVALMALVAVLAALFVRASVPVVVLWVLVCMIKMICVRRWSVALLVGATFLYPLIPTGGTPAYAVFVLMVCSAAVALDWSDFDNRLGFVKNWSALGLALVLLVSVAGLRLGLHVPVLSELANPLLAEREKTYQLEKIADWLLSSKYREHQITFYHGAGPPSVTTDAIDRRHRAPSEAWLITAYLDDLRQGQGIAKGLIVSFGSEDIQNAKEIYRVQGKYAGEARVYVPAGDASVDMVALRRPGGKVFTAL